MYEGQHIRLRAYTKADLPLAVAFLNEPETRRLLAPGPMFPFKLEDEEKWYDSFNGMSLGDYNFAIETLQESTYIGGCGIKDTDQKNRFAEIGIFLGRNYTDRGYGTEAMQLLSRFCFDELNLNKVKVHVYAFNPRAIRCYEKLGFQKEGVLRDEVFRDGAYHNVITMGLLRAEAAHLDFF